MKKTKLTILMSLLLMTASFSLQAAETKLGVINFTEVLNKSKYGQEEQKSMEALKEQMTKLIEDIEKQLNDVAEKFNDPDYLDSLSPEGELELKTQYQTLNDEMSRYQNQYYQIVNQANMKLIQSMNFYIQRSAERIAKAQDISIVLNKDASYYSDPKLDITQAVIQDLDKDYESENKKTSQVEPNQASEGISYEQGAN